MNWAGTETIQAEELTVIPGLDEIFALIDVKTHVESGQLRRAGRRLRADRGDAPAAVAPRDHELVHRADLPGGAEGREGGASDRVADDVAADRRRSRLRGDRAAAREPRRGEADPDRRGRLDRAAGGEPREDGDHRGAAHLHVPRAVRVPRRRGGREPGPAPRRRPTRTSGSGRTSRPSTWRRCTSRSNPCRS